jgi:lipopolysaccharide heptosyltransferase II
MPVEARVPAGWGQVRRVLAVRLDNVGDAVMLGPALRTLRATLPRVAITLMCTPAGEQVAPMLPWIDDLLVHSAVWQDASGTMPLDPEGQQALVARLRAGRYDAAVIFTSFSQSPYPPAYACYLSGIPIRLGQSKEFGGGILSHWVRPPADAAHGVDRNLHLLAATGFTVGDRTLALRLPVAAEARADELLRENGIAPHERFAIVAPGASCAARRYPAERFAAVTRGLLDAGLRVITSGTARERPLVEQVQSAAGPSAVALAGEATLPELAALIARAAVVVCNDSGPMHLADALRTPVVALFSGTDLESQWAPRSTRAALLRRPTPCAPCYLFACDQPRPHDAVASLACLDIDPAEVVAAALTLAGQAAPTHSADRLPSFATVATSSSPFPSREGARG